MAIDASLYRAQNPDRLTPLTGGERNVVDPMNTLALYIEQGMILAGLDTREIHNVAYLLVGRERRDTQLKAFQPHPL